MLEAKDSVCAHKNPNYRTLLAFKPRQVLLAERSTKVTATTKTMKKCNNGGTLALNPDQKALLLESVLSYLEHNGFSRALKRLLSEAHIETDDWKACSLNLEDLYGKYLQTCAHFEANTELLTDRTNKKSEDTLGTVLEQAVGDKKKKKSSKGETNAVENQPQNGIAESSKNSLEVQVKDSLAGSNAELKAKKKSKKVQMEQVITQASKESPTDTVSQLEIDECSKEKTDKKKKKSKSVSEPHEADVGPVPVQSANEENLKSSLDDLKTDSEAEGKSKDKKKKKKKPSMDAIVENVNKPALENMHDVPLEEKKSSKKRKRLASEENEVQQVQELASEESKRRKTVTLEETKTSEKITGNANAGDGTESKRENGSIEEHKLQNASIEQNEEPTNRNFRKDGVNSATPKTRRKQHEGSAEPKSVNAFQRVKIDEVKFADDRLQDNSYWAKDGADIGYGAKAQEVLGQVKGRDFRHEKTKKKRGSYRGGQIDLQAHSVKFNYSDED